MQQLPLMARLGALLPAGRALDAASWSARHRNVVALLALHVPALGIYGFVQGVNPLHIFAEVGALTVLALMAQLPQLTRTQQAAIGTIGLISSSALLVHLSGGLIEAHFHFFVMVGVITLYQSWVPFLLAMGYVVLHHGVMGALDPNSVYNHPAAQRNPWLWAGIHGLFITGASLAGLRSWKYAEVERERAEDAAVALNDKVRRQQEAVELNDTVVQGLVVAKYAHDLGDVERARHAVDRVLTLAQELVSDLVADGHRPQPGSLTRSVAADLTEGADDPAPAR